MFLWCPTCTLISKVILSGALYSASIHSWYKQYHFSSLAISILRMCFSPNTKHFLKHCLGQEEELDSQVDLATPYTCLC